MRRRRPLSQRVLPVWSVWLIIVVACAAFWTGAALLALHLLR